MQTGKHDCVVSYLGLDVLASPAGYIVDNGRSILESVFDVHDNTLVGSLSVVWVNEQGSIHATCESLLCCVVGFCSRVGAGVTNDDDSSLSKVAT